ncbi:hypothetical protein FHR71_002012 [Methylobacterium sp. RAS18]|nr:hypothetical protein [Methylobacterium sp. RAS18]
MQRFYFNLRTPQGREVDRKGRNLRSAEEAFLEAYWAAPLLAMEVVSQGGDLNHYIFEVMNEAGQLVWDLSFHEALGRIFRLRRSDPPALN